MQQEQQLLIGGSWVPAESGRSFERRNPYTGETASTAAAAAAEDADRALAAALAAFPEWAAAAPALRREVLGAAAELMQERAEHIAATMTEETGGTFGWGMFNVQLASGMLREAAAQAYSATGQVIPSDVPGATALALRQPVGPVVGIAPWNAPVILGTRAVAAPLAFGNTVVLKASERCPRTHAAIAEAIADAGAPAGVVNLLTNAPEDAAAVVERLIANPASRRINFTGSSEVGRVIATKAGEHLKRVLLELGGKAPMIVMEDADVGEAVAAASFGAFMHQGQICMSTERVLVHSSLAERFTGALVARAEALAVGDPGDAATQIGPMVDAGAVERLTGLIADAESKGARVLTGGVPDGPFFPPTVVADLTPQMRLHSEESFGPIVTVAGFDDVEQAIATANDSRYGLAAAVFSRDIPAALDVASRVESGICHVNSSTVHDEPQMPFGGVKDSGWGRFGGSAALEEFTELRWTMVQGAPRQYPI